ncbi:hypothetical protein HK096_010968, partial [Nowakowskiella sp. JEL0078]
MKKVDVYRLLAKDTLEEVIWQRAKRKLALSEGILSASSVEQSMPEDLITILNFGLSKILLDTDKKVDTDTLDELIQNAEQIFETNDDGKDKDLIYLFEGHDYKSDLVAFSKLKEEFAITKTSIKSLPRIKSRFEDARTEERQFEYEEKRKEKQISRETTRLKKQFAEWEDKKFRSHALENKAAHTYEIFKEHCGDHGEEQDILRDSLKKALKQISHSIEKFAECAYSADEKNLQFVSGDVTKPQKFDGNSAIIIHLVDNSGIWPNRGVFAALESLDNKIPE